MPSNARTLWKGAISFGLVHVPVSLHTAVSDTGVDFDWLDKRTMDPVGYKRINKKSGKEITKEHIVRGVAYEEGQYVVLSDEEIGAAYPQSTQSIEIEAFVAATEIPFVYLDRPYYLAPIGKGAKVYALLRDTLLASGRIGLARVVISSKQHLAALVPSGPALVLNLLRWGDQIRSMEDLQLPAQGKAAGLSDRELSMAQQLVDDMTTPWDPKQFRDSFKDEVMALVARKVKAGKTSSVTAVPAQAVPGTGAEIIDLTDLLRRSLRRGSTPEPAAAKTAAPRRKTAGLSKAPARKRAA